VWSAANNTAGKIDGWNVERGTTQDLVFGAHSALEDEGYVPFYETHFYKSGTHRFGHLTSVPPPLADQPGAIHVDRIHHVVGRRR
jgi:hypothetical protein